MLVTHWLMQDEHQPVLVLSLSLVASPVLVLCYSCACTTLYQGAQAGCMHCPCDCWIYRIPVQEEAAYILIQGVLQGKLGHATALPSSNPS